MSGQQHSCKSNEHSPMVQTPGGLTRPRAAWPQPMFPGQYWNLRGTPAPGNASLVPAHLILWGTCGGLRPLEMPPWCPLISFYGEPAGDSSPWKCLPGARSSHSVGNLRGTPAPGNAPLVPAHLILRLAKLHGFIP